MRYNTSTIQKACKMFREGRKIKDILRETGIKSHMVIYWHCSPEKRAKQTERGRQWRENNIERWRAICRKSTARFKKKQAK